MKLHEDEKQFEQAVQFTAQQNGIKEIYVEKDYWVTFALHSIFKSEAAAYAVFKGGTALSKCYRIIDRFSEDIDLVVLKKEGETSGSVKKKLKTISSLIEDVMPEIEIKEVTNKKGEIRKTAHTYPKKFKGAYGQVRDSISLESSVLGFHEPSELKTIQSLIHDMMMEAKQDEMIVKNNLKPFEIRVLRPERTLCEKIMSLVRFSYVENPIESLKLKVRHLYDLHQILKIYEFSLFFNSKEFDAMLLKVGQDDKHGYKTGIEWLSKHPKDALIFSSSKDIWNDLKTVYTGTFADLVFGKLPNEAEILLTLNRVSKRLEGIEWDIKQFQAI